MDPFEYLVKTTDPFSEKCIYVPKIEVLRFIEVNKHFWSLGVINYFVAYISY
jgi:hypothetical protein